MTTGPELVKRSSGEIAGRLSIAEFIIRDFLEGEDGAKRRARDFLDLMSEWHPRHSDPNP